MITDFDGLAVAKFENSFDRKNASVFSESDPPGEIDQTFSFSPDFWDDNFRRRDFFRRRCSRFLFFRWFFCMKKEEQMELLAGA